MKQVTVFFYGLFMDTGVLARKGVRAIDPKIARLAGYRLRIGKRATLVPDPIESVYGIRMRVSTDDLGRLYSEPSVVDYRPEAVRVVLGDGQTVEARCYNLPSSLEQSEPNPGYAATLHELAARLGLPQSHLDKIAQAGGTN
jgi:hypothetical protein